MNFDYLAQDFLYLLDLCRPPEQVFPEGSKELKLTHMWMEHLTLYECENLNDRRLANVYMSHLCAALAQGKLYGPFLGEPPQGKLKKVDFLAMTASCSLDSLIEFPETSTGQMTMRAPATMRECTTQMGDYDVSYSKAKQPSYRCVNGSRIANSTAFESQGQISVGSTNLSHNVSTGGNLSPSNCSCPPKPCQCGKSGSVCTCNRSTAGADKSLHDEESICSYLMQELNLTPGYLKNFDTTFNSIINLYNTSSLADRKLTKNPSSISTPQTSLTLQPSTSQTSVLQCPKQSRDDPATSAQPPDYKEMREDICELMEAISAELRGDVEPGANDYLDRELARYKNFVMSHSDLAKHAQTLSTGMKFRNFLLLGFQRDLVQLFCDLMPTEENN